ncbi:hypothetical protein MMC11_002622 [Xylographa trunciseda]|nr:hypothetical protein [Xylographa trunciseda]
MPELSGSTKGKYLCLTICGYRKPGMSGEGYCLHMVNVSTPLKKILMVKYGVKRWTQLSCSIIVSPQSTPSPTKLKGKIHNQCATRALMSQLYDPQMCKVADSLCLSQVVFKSREE